MSALINLVISFIFTVFLSFFLQNRVMQIKCLNIISAYFLLVVLIYQIAYETNLYFQQLFWVLAICLTFIFVLILAANTFNLQENQRIEFTLITWCILISSCFLIGSSDLNSILILLECIALCSYTLVGFERTNKHSTASGLQYLILAAIPGGLFILGISIFYSHYGTLVKDDLILILDHWNDEGILYPIKKTAEGCCSNEFLLESKQRIDAINDFYYFSDKTNPSSADYINSNLKYNFRIFFDYINAFFCFFEPSDLYYWINYSPEHFAFFELFQNAEGPLMKKEHHWNSWFAIHMQMYYQEHFDLYETWKAYIIMLDKCLEMWTLYYSLYYYTFIISNGNLDLFLNSGFGFLYHWTHLDPTVNAPFIEYWVFFLAELFDQDVVLDSFEFFEYGGFSRDYFYAVENFCEILNTKRLNDTFDLMEAVDMVEGLNPFYFYKSFYEGCEITFEITAKNTIKFVDYFGAPNYFILSPWKVFQIERVDESLESDFNQEITQTVVGKDLLAAFKYAVSDFNYNCKELLDYANGNTQNKVFNNTVIDKDNIPVFIKICSASYKPYQHDAFYFIEDTFTKTFGEWFIEDEPVSLQTDTILFFALLFIITAIAFKLTASPFHSWAPIVYGGAPLPTVIYLTTFSKLTLIFFAILIFGSIFESLSYIWRPLFYVMGFLSIIISVLGAFSEKVIKRFFIYSSIGHVGFMLIGICDVFTDSGLLATISYLILYIISSVIFWCILLYLGKNNLTIVNLKGLGRDHPIIGAVFSITLFSLSGIPPLGGFFVKYAILSSLINSSMFLLGYLLLLLTVISAFYYLRLIKIMYFEKSKTKFSPALDKDSENILLRVIIYLSGFLPFIIFYVDDNLISIIINMIKKSM